MPILALTPFPGRAAPDIRVQADIARLPDGATLRLGWRVTGDIARLAWHGAGGAGRSDDLWRHGCFEAFVGCGGPAYVELNAAPSRRWAAYAFDDYRAGMRAAAAAVREQNWTLGAAVAAMELLVALPDARAGDDWTAGLSAVIETTGGDLSYWALAHPGDRPDFHNRNCFVARLPAPGRV